MITTNTIPARAAIGRHHRRDLLRRWPRVAPSRAPARPGGQPPAQHAAADDVAALVEYRKAALTPEMGRASTPSQTTWSAGSSNASRFPSRDGRRSHSS